jgi:nicotinamide riboside transporter PnuC
MADRPTFVTQEEADKIALVLKQRHARRWRGLAVWIIVFTVITFWALHSVRNQAATVHDLQHTNCNLKSFLLSAKAVRITAANDPKQKESRTINLKAAVGYQVLADNITAVGHCHVPAAYLVPVPKS